MVRIDHDKVTNILREVAATEIMPYFRKLDHKHISYKIGDDPVTIADHASEKALERRLIDLLPGSKLFGEEGFAANPAVFEHLSGESPVWIVDPIDGTRNFVAGNDHWGIIVALVERNQTVAGWIYSPTSDEVVTAELEGGAWYKGQKLKTLPSRPLPQMSGFIGDMLMTAHREHKTHNMTIDPSFDTMHVGVVEYAALVIDGMQFGQNLKQRHFRASYSYSKPWDDAAGILIYQEAGGYVSLWDGRPYQPNIINHGLALAPDKASWLELKAWCESFTQLPKHIGSVP